MSVLVRVIESATGKEVKRYGPMPTQRAEKIEHGLLRQMNTERYHVSVDQPRPSARCIYTWNRLRPMFAVEASGQCGRTTTDPTGYCARHRHLARVDESKR